MCQYHIFQLHACQLHIELTCSFVYNPNVNPHGRCLRVEKFVCLAPGVYRLAVPFPGCWAGAYLVTGKENILVDSGGCAETVDSAIVPALKELGLTLQDISWLAFTHIHGDHVGGCGRLKELNPQLKVAVFRDSLERMRNPLAYSAQIRAKFPGHSAGTPARLDGAEPDLLLSDGDMLGDLMLLHTPGHDTDSCCYLDVRTKTLLTGDSLQLNGTVSQGCALLMDANGYENTLHRLLDMDIENIACGHPYLPLGADATGREAARAYLKKCLACFWHDEGFVQGMLAAGVTDAPAIAKALIRNVGGKEPGFLFLPLYTVTEYIQRSK